MIHSATTTIDVTWYCIGALWLAMAFGNKRTVVRRGFTVRLLLVALVFEVVIRHGSTLGNDIHRQVWTPTASLAWLGVALVLAGAAWGVWARFTIGTNWSGSVTLKEDHELIQRGPYAFVRHPIYTALFTMLLGTALAYGQWETTALFALALVIFGFKMRSEEKLMTEAFPTQYPEYRRRVKAIIPFVL